MIRGDEIKPVSEQELVQGINAIAELQNTPAWRMLVRKLSEDYAEHLKVLHSSADPYAVVRAAGAMRVINDVLTMYDAERETRQRMIESMRNTQE